MPFTKTVTTEGKINSGLKLQDLFGHLNLKHLWDIQEKTSDKQMNRTGSQ